MVNTKLIAQVRRIQIFVPVVGQYKSLWYPELENGVWIDTISPGVVEDLSGYFPFFSGHIPVTMPRVARAYVKSVLGAQTGEVYKVF